MASEPRRVRVTGVRSAISARRCFCSLGQVPRHGDGPLHPLDLGGPVPGPQQPGPDLDLTQHPALPVGVHAQGGRRALDEAGQDQLVGIGSLVVASHLGALIGHEVVPAGPDLSPVAGRS